MKSNIKPEEFYQEAEAMQGGWGETLRAIDELKDKVQAEECITLKEAQYILYGKGWASYYWDKFGGYCTKKLKVHRKTIPWEAWEGIFLKWVKTDEFYQRTLNNKGV